MYRSQEVSLYIQVLSRRSGPAFAISTHKGEGEAVTYNDDSEWGFLRIRQVPSVLNFFY